MKIAVFGYYNALNAGDDRIQACLSRLLKGHTVVFLPHYLPPPEDYLQSFDWILIGGGGLVFDPVGIWVNTRQWVRRCRAKIGMVGLGVNRLSSALSQEVAALLEAASFCYVRDQTSKALLQHHPKVEVFPDLSWCFPLEAPAQPLIGSDIAVNLAPCSWKSFQPDAWNEALSPYDWSPFPLNFNEGRDRDLLQTLSHHPIPEEFSLEPLWNSRLLIACRYHAIAFAIQLRKPFIAINYDDKVKRLLMEQDLMDCCLETTEPDRLPEKIAYVLDHYEELQQRLERVAIAQTQQAQVLATHIQSHINQPTQTDHRPLAPLKTCVKHWISRQ